jgi:hypothetical protein
MAPVLMGRGSDLMGRTAEKSGSELFFSVVLHPGKTNNAATAMMANGPCTFLILLRFNIIDYRSLH